MGQPVRMCRLAAMALEVPTEASHIPEADGPGTLAPTAGSANAGCRALIEVL
jgi:hypothetical protein